MEQHYYSKMEEEGDGNRKGDDLIKSVFQPKKVVDTFQPWPSIEEVRNKRSSLQSIKDKVNEEGKKKFSYNDYPLSVSKNGNDIGKTVMELKSFKEMVNNKKSDKKSNKKSDKKIKEEDNNIEKISKTVPLKKKSIFSKGNLISTAIATASHGADFLLGKSGREKEDEVCLTKEIDKPSKSHSDSVKRMAPTVEFGDDDSPRVALN